MYFHQNFQLIFQKSLTSNIFLDPKEGDNPPLPPMRMYDYVGNDINALKRWKLVKRYIKPLIVQIKVM